VQREFLDDPLDDLLLSLNRASTVRWSRFRYEIASTGLLASLRELGDRGEIRRGNLESNHVALDRVDHRPFHEPGVLVHLPKQDLQGVRSLDVRSVEPQTSAHRPGPHDQALKDIGRPERALDRAGFAIVATGLKQCLSEEGGADALDVKKMEKLFLSLA